MENRGFGHEKISLSSRQFWKGFAVMSFFAEFLPIFPRGMDRSAPKPPLCKGDRRECLALRWHGVSRDGGIVRKKLPSRIGAGRIRTACCTIPQSKIEDF